MKHSQARPARTAEPFERSPASSFESLLDDNNNNNNAAAAERAAPPASKPKASSASAQAASKPAKADKPADNNNANAKQATDQAAEAGAPDQAADAGKTPKLQKADASDLTVISDEAGAGSSDDKKVGADPIAVDVLAVAQTAAEAIPVIPTETPNVAGNAVPPAAPLETGAAEAIATNASTVSEAGTSPALSAVTADKESEPAATDRPPSAPIDLTAQKDKPGPAAGTQDAVTASAKTDSAKPAQDDAAAEASLQPQGDDKPESKGPATESDKQPVAHPRSEATAPVRQTESIDASAATHADTGAAAAKAASDAAAPQVASTTSHTAASSASSASAATAQNAPQATAIPLAGVAVEIAGKALAGKNRFEIRLDPPELGRIEVRLDVDRSGQVTSRLIVDRAETLDLLRRDASGLERALQDAGLKTADNGLHFSLRDGSTGQEQRQSGTETARLLVEEETVPTDTIPQVYGRLGGRSGGLDIRV